MTVLGNNRFPFQSIPMEHKFPTNCVWLSRLCREQLQRPPSHCHLCEQCRMVPANRDWLCTAQDTIHVSETPAPPIGDFALIKTPHSARIRVALFPSGHRLFRVNLHFIHSLDFCKHWSICQAKGPGFWFGGEVIEILLSTILLFHFYWGQCGKQPQSHVLLEHHNIKSF